MRRTLARVHQARDAQDGAALITALLLILVTATFAIVMLGVLLSQITPTQLQQATTRTVFGAEAGVNAVVGQIRNAEGAPDAEGKVYGDTSELPCTAAGTVASAAGDVTYEATIQYYNEDPTGKSDSWREANDIACIPGAGPSQDPTHALITSSGSGTTVAVADGTLERTIQVVYAFKVTNSNIPGGYIYSWDQTLTFDRFCLEASAVEVGATIRYVAAADCGDDDAQQLWVYDKDYRIKLAATTLPTYSGEPLCITATPNGSTPVNATLQECLPTNDGDRWNQLWSWMGSATWQGQQNPISNGYSNFFLSSGSTGAVAVGTTLKVWTGAGGGAEWGSFNPDPRVGAGAAGYSTHQIVNYLEFGRCADVTHGTISRDQMIVYPCKQDPDPAGTRLNWNHKWFYTEPTNGIGASAEQQIYVMVNGTTKYCLRSAGTEGGYVTFTSTCSTTDKSQQWVRYGDTGAYDTSYVFMDGYGRCLDLGPWYKQGTAQQEAWSTMVTKSCSASLSQKWNAPASEASAALGGYWELP